MENSHFSDAELIDRLYGLEAQEGHLDLCPLCRRRLQALADRKAALSLAEPHISPGFLVEQRHAIWVRLAREQSAIKWGRWIPAFAGAAALAVVLVSSQPTPKIEPGRVAVVSDAQLYADISAVVETPEPFAATPIRGLFDQEQKEVVR